MITIERFQMISSILEIQQTLIFRNCFRLPSHEQTDHVPLAVDRKQISSMHFALYDVGHRCSDGLCTSQDNRYL